MDVGQIMMQMSTGIVSTVSAPASAEMAAMPAGEPSEGTFAGMLRGMSPLISGASVVVADAATTVITTATDSSRITADPKPAEVNADIMAALMAMAGTRDQMPAAVGVYSEDESEPPVESAQPDVLMPQDVALLAAGTQIVLVAGGNGRMPESGQKVELQDEPEIPVELAQPEVLIPQDVALFAAGTQIVLSAGGNGRMPELDQKINPQTDDRNLLQRSVGLAGAVAMPASATKGLSQATMAAQLAQSVELTQSVQATAETDSMLNSETTAGKIDAPGFPKVVAKEDGRGRLVSSAPAAASLDGAMMETVAISAEEVPVLQRAEEKSTLLTAATAANGMAANGMAAKEMPVIQAGRSQDVQPAQADSNKQMDIPADVRTVKASEIVRPNPATVVLEAVGRKAVGQDDGIPVQLDTATIQKDVEGVSGDVTKISSSSTPEKGLLDEGGKDSSDHGTNNHFHQATAHQQVKADAGTSLDRTSGAAQKDMLHSDMSENVFRQVKEVLANREVKTGSEQITMRLSPEHLGELTLNLKMENQQLKVEIVAANRGVRDALMQQVDNLKETLARQNITMESFDVMTNSGQRGFEQNDRGWKQLAQQQFMAGTSTGGYRYRTPEVEEVAVPRYGMQKQYAMVDVHY